MEGFRSSPDFQIFFGAVQSFFNGIEEMQHYEPNTHQEMKSNFVTVTVTVLMMILYGNQSGKT